ncbi:hypothetical protein P153DRAFT_387309 [Dothidotthia symphoricarpi CBS 119687]|uniref:Uncharacterized protein n=1 Tax=Dothidotthia symphoricarpi CBS 119687 TaxID=1392245 RepID=A0A6A6A9P9_9PLEO|nr:uncharacterized protein P153DRAFT_387309 [Dothidotthia symphoricarpi CBS 119687]KAF2127567.1 hypothetical protein P153DRAFT_387309 [Dothidotthia symphoricarpi CBS 119687]
MPNMGLRGVYESALRFCFRARYLDPLDHDAGEVRSRVDVSAVGVMQAPSNLPPRLALTIEASSVTKQHIATATHEPAMGAPSESRSGRTRSPADIAAQSRRLLDLRSENQILL